MAAETITIVGAGIFGLWQALLLGRAGHRVRLIEESETPFSASASRLAGAMIAPDCEAEAALEYVRVFGHESLAMWRQIYPGLIDRGTLVVAPPRDVSEIQRFARLTGGHEHANARRIAELEPSLAGRFDRGLYFSGEAHMDAGAALGWLLNAVRATGADVQFGKRWEDSHEPGWTIDCRGLGARMDLPSLRGVRGERVLIFSRDVSFSRPVRLLHPRQPIYVVPQGDGRFVIGATVIEREDAGPMTLKSALDLLGATYVLHPAFAEAEIVDMGAGVRPSFPDHLPRAVIAGERIIRVNGAYRHGFLLAPVMAKVVGDYIATGAHHTLIA